MKDKTIETILEKFINSPKLIREFIDKRMKPELREPDIGITRYHFEVLGMLNESGKMSISELGEILVISKPQMTRLINELSNNGKITRERDPRDRRKTIVSLTDEGQECISKVMDRFYQDIRKRLQPFSGQELDEILLSMNKVSQFLKEVLLN